ncbi:MAG: YdbH domain-containing protein [Phycisphaeraceae bacterium]
MKRLMRWIVWRVAVLAAMVAAGWGAYVYVLPGVIEGKIKAALTEAGFAKAVFVMEGLPTLSRMVVKDVKLDEQGRMRIGRVEVWYDPARLLSGRVAMVKVTGVRWRVEVDEKGEMVTGLAPAPAPAPAPGSEVTGSLAERVERVEVADVVVEIARGDRTQDVAIRRGVWSGEDWLIWMDATDVSLDERSVTGGWLAKMTGLKMSGTVTLSGEGEPAAELKDVTIGSADRRYEMRGLEGRVTLRSVWPVRSEGGQVLRWREAAAGPTSFGQGLVRFTLDNPRKLLIEQVSWRWGEAGRLWLGAAWVDPMDFDLNAQLFMERVDLDQWLDAVSVGYAEGTGQLFGRVGLRVKAEPGWRLALGEGYLYTVEGGKVKVGDASMVERVLAEQLRDDDRINAAVRERIVRALQSFDYKLLSFVMWQRADGEQVMSVHVSGEGGEAKQGLDLTVNLTGYEDVMDLGLRLKLGLDRAADKGMKRLMNQRRSP